LQKTLEHLGVKVTVLKSDEEFNRCNLVDFDFVILDPWTWAAKGGYFF
jgi:hypothetical protein